MNILEFILLISIAQLLISLGLLKLKTGYISHFIFVGVLFLYFFYFPKLWLNIIVPLLSEIDCGMPALGTTMVFWFFGIFAATITHAIYLLIQSSFMKKENENSDSLFK